MYFQNNYVKSSNDNDLILVITLNQTNLAMWYKAMYQFLNNF